jgi:PAS domain S-box-containing protein
MSAGFPSIRALIVRSLRWIWPTKAGGVRRTMRSKLMGVVAATTTAALLISATATLLRDLNRYKQSQAAELTTEADILALATGPALAFDDRTTAQRTLAALRARPAVLVAGLYDARGVLFARYERAGAATNSLLSSTHPPGLRIIDGRVELTREVLSQRERVGTLYLAAAYEATSGLTGYLGIVGLVTALSLAVALVASTALQRALMAPLDAVANVARRVVDQRDYSLRASKTSDDEIGLVVEAFNDMLGAVQDRDHALEQGNSALRESEARFRATFEVAAVGFANVTPEGHFTLVNDRLCQALGYTREELLQRTFADITHPDDLNADWQHVHELLAGRAATYAMEKRYLHKSGRTVWANLTVSLLRDEAGVPQHFISVIEDIGKRKAAEDALLERERRFTALANAVPQLVWVSDPTGTIEYLNEGWYRFAGRSPAAHLESWFELLHEEDHARALRRWQRALRSGLLYEDEFRLRKADGSYRWFLARATADRDSGGLILRWFGTCTDVDNAKRIEADLRATEEALREADQRKDVFIATLAHELRNPLAPLRIAARLLASPSLDAAQLESTRAIIARQTTQMALLLDDLLDASRITRGALELKKDYVDLADSVAAAVEAARPLLERKQHRLTLHQASQPIILEADPLRLTQIITNLLTNAGKYTDPGGEISLSTEIRGAVAVIAVRDSGIGLAPQTLPKLFEMFSQAQAAGTRSEGGLGIGLALARGLTELHGGHIEAHSEGVGKGSEFRVFLPRPLKAADAQEPAADESQIQSAKTRRVLIVDDNRDAADSLALFLRLAGHEVSVAYSGAQALQVAAGLHPDLLLLDIGMPGMNGYQLAAALRGMSWSASATLVAVTGWGQEEDVQRARAAGFDHHMTKPIDPAAIQALLHEIDQSGAATPGDR